MKKRTLIDQVTDRIEGELASRFTLLLKQNYKSKDGTIKKGMEVFG